MSIWPKAGGLGLLVLTLALGGCAVVPPSGVVVETPTPTIQEPVSTPTPTLTIPPAQPSPTPTPTPVLPAPDPAPDPEPTKPGKDTRRGKQLKVPYQVNGVVVVSKKHRVAASYRPTKPTGPFHLEAAAAKALTRMTRAAKADGVRIRVRSGYRDWDAQNASYRKALKNYPHNIDYYAPAGASEHQTGLAVDLWDGVTWSLPMANTATGKWLFKHAHDYGFVLRYPKDKRKITGYHYEPWHYRFVGVEHSKKFGKSNSLTLEEYLGLA